MSERKAREAYPAEWRGTWFRPGVPGGVPSALAKRYAWAEILRALGGPGRGEGEGSMSAFSGIIALVVLIVLIVLAVALWQAGPEEAFRPAAAITAGLDRFAGWLECQGAVVQGLVAAGLLFGMLAVVAIVEGRP